MLKLQKSTDLGRPVVAEESALYRYRTHTMTQSEFQRLEKSQWLSDATINMFLQAYVTDKIDRAHCFSSHFFTQLLSAHPADPCELVSDDDEESGGPGVENQFNYQAVQNYSNACGGLTSNGLFTLDNLLIPAHVDGNHWIILRVNFEEKRIELYDSMGTVNPTYNRLLDALRRYIYCELDKTPTRALLAPVQFLVQYMEHAQREPPVPQATQWIRLRGIHNDLRIPTCPRRATVPHHLRPGVR